MYYDNLTLLTDFYELTMMQGFKVANIQDRKVVFDLFYRSNPCANGFSIACGLEQVIDYVKNLKFSSEDLDYLRGLNIFSEEFLEYLRDFKFTGDIYAIPEGTVVFPHEPLLRISAPLPEAQLLETAILNIINHQSLIATKAARVVWAAGGDTVLEFGLRRAQGPDAGIYGARAAIIGGCRATSNVLTGKMFNVPVRGTNAHSWVMSFPDELTAFREYAKVFPQNCILIADTYNTLKSGVPNAIKVFNELKEEYKTLKNYGIRLDSGDLAYLSKEARKMLDDAGFPDAVISASSDLDEYLIRDLILQGSKITVWGVGTSLITSKDCPAFGGVYKLVAQEDAEGNIVPKIKLSENVDKVTNPGIKKIFRFYDLNTGKAEADLITMDNETIDPSKDMTIFDPLATWKRKTFPANQYTVKELLVPVFINGECVYNSPAVSEIQEHCRRDMDTFWDEYKRIVKPQQYRVDLSENLWNLKKNMIDEFKNL